MLRSIEARGDTTLAADSNAIARAFDKAIAGVKNEDPSSVQSLGSLLGSIATAMDDGTLMLAGFSITSCAGILVVLKNFEAMNPPGLKPLLHSAFGELSGSLEELKPQLAAGGRDHRIVLQALGRVATTTFSLQQKMTELQQLFPLRPPGRVPPG